MQRILVIQTAFIGDVVLATALLEKLNEYYPNSLLDILVRKGNETLFLQHPFLNEVLIWDKQGEKYPNLFKTIRKIRSNRYDLLVNLQRYAATGVMTALAGAKRTIGFDKNPLSFLFTDKLRHTFSGGGEPVHEIERNHLLIASFTDDKPAKPRLYPTEADEAAVHKLKATPYVCIAPASVWFTKQFPAGQWTSFINSLPSSYKVYLLGGPGDNSLCESICSNAQRNFIENLSGRLSYLQSAALMRDSVMNYVNDSAPLHFASSVNAPVTAVYCSTIPAFGYGPLSDNSHIVEIQQPLSCRPCGIHGRPACPLVHFNCARLITTNQLLDCLPS